MTILQLINVLLVLAGPGVIAAVAAAVVQQAIAPASTLWPNRPVMRPRPPRPVRPTGRVVWA